VGNIYGYDFLYAGPLFIHLFSHAWIPRAGYSQNNRSPSHAWMHLQDAENFGAMVPNDIEKNFAAAMVRVALHRPPYRHKRRWRRKRRSTPRPLPRRAINLIDPEKQQSS
jgi:hypothetical protein